MKKISILSSALFALGALTAQAGGLLTNTNQNAAFLRNFAQEGQITLTSLYANPAGNAFLSPGWHMSINSQTAIQQRNIKTTFPLFGFNAANPGQTTHEFKGEALAPVIPSITLSHNWDRWSLSAHFGLTGGGGKCEFDKGLGSFEALYGGNLATNIITGIANQYATTAGPTAIPAYLAAGMTMEQAQAKLATEAATYGKTQFGTNPSSYLQGYQMDAYMKGRSYYFGLQLGGAYKIQDNLSAYIGLRGVYATCNYNGYVQDFKAAIMGQPMANMNSDLALNCDQTGFGITPIFGLDWEINKHWNVAVKYEANTRMSLKNKSEMNEVAAAQAAQEGNTLAQFKDGEKVREDIPAILALGAEYRLNDKVRFDGSAKMYFDKTARKYGNKEDLVDHNTWEVAVGAEYDINSVITVSASYQSTNYGLSDKYMNDLSFNLSNNSIGLGVRIHPSKYFNIDLGYMHTFYGDRSVTTPTAIGNKLDVYNRKNDVIGIGFNITL
ncbi:MAG: outer membrane protein transport protein [Bacteroidales bacterium]|nr:outer membrane protein transport protein [Bacteroidales bacterium]